MKFSYTWLRELVPGLKNGRDHARQQITMKTRSAKACMIPARSPAPALPRLLGLKTPSPTHH